MQGQSVAKSLADFPKTQKCLKLYQSYSILLLVLKQLQEGHVKHRNIRKKKKCQTKVHMQPSCIVTTVVCIPVATDDIPSNNVLEVLAKYKLLLLKFLILNSRKYSQTISSSISRNPQFYYLMENLRKQVLNFLVEKLFHRK